MRLERLFLTTLLFSGLGLALPAEVIKTTVSRPKARFTIEFEDSLDKGIHKRFLDSTEDIDVHHQFDHEHFSGMSFSIEDNGESTIGELLKKPGVKNVWRSTVVRKRNAVVASNARPIFNPDSLTGVLQLHARNITGQGIVIGMIDSGVDASHPALKGKILPGYDFCFNTSSQPPSNDNGGHGTFCASVAVGKSSEIMGVAPDAKLRMYKVNTACMSDDDIIEIFDDTMLMAILKAYDDKVNLISISQGLDMPFGTSPMAVGLERVAKLIPIIYAASNSAELGLYSGLDGGSAKDVIAVASYQSQELLFWNSLLVDEKGIGVNLSYVSDNGWVLPTNNTYKVDYVPDLCSLVNGTYEGVGKFVAGRLTENCDYSLLVTALPGTNYTGVLYLVPFENISYPQLPPSMSFFSIATYSNLTDLFKANPNGLSLKFNMNQRYSLRVTPNRLRRLLLEFSSWGPTFDQGFYPHVAAPGGLVLGAKANGTYEIESGTSFSCPYVAGVVALYLSGHKNATSAQVKNNLISTAKMTANNQIKKIGFMYNVTYNDNLLAPVIQQGNGYIDLVAFYDLKTNLVSDPYLELNDTVHRVADHVIKFQNNGNATVRYDISHDSYELVYARTPNGFISDSPPTEAVMSNIVLYSLNLTTLNPGESASFNVSISAPKGLNQTLAPLFSGAFKISGTNGEVITVPYLGMEFNATEWSIWAPSKPVKIGYASEGEIIYLNDTVKSNKVLSKPIVVNQMAYGTTYLSFDLVSPSYNLLSYVYPPVEGQNGYIGPITAQTVIDEVYILGASPMRFVSPAAKPFAFTFSQFSNSSIIENGTYKLLYRALRIFGNESNYNDWSLGLTPEFTVDFSEMLNDTSQTTSTSTSTRSKGSASSYGFSSALIFLNILFAFL